MPPLFYFQFCLLVLTLYYASCIYLFYFRFFLLVLTLYYASCVIYLYCIMSNVFVISHVLTQDFNILQDGASVSSPGGRVR
jgi:hypothetical protein